MANSQDGSSSQHPDLLAAVVLHTLVGNASDGLTTAAVAVACDRDPNAERDIDEIVVALEILLADGLAEQELDPLCKPERTAGLDTGPAADTKSEPRYRPTRAAIRAHELSF